MTDDLERPAQNPEEGLQVAPLAILVGALLLLAIFSPWGWHLPIGFLLSQVVIISLVIWQACDPFADAAQWIGAVFRLPGSVRGATLDAVASSMPELFSGIFFVIVAVTAADDSPAALARAGAEGFGSTVATCAGSAIYNMTLIPAFCALVISFRRKSRPTIDVESEVISRDGMWFIGCEALLIMFLFQDEMHWWMAVVLLSLYWIYVFQLYGDAKQYQRAMDAIRAHLGTVGEQTPTAEIVESLRAEGLRANPRLVDEIKRTGSDQPEAQADESAHALFGAVNIPLGRSTAAMVILFSTLVAAAACYWLVEVTRLIAQELAVPVFFVAVILAAAASSFPDTFLSIGAALRGDDSGAVSNAFGSNIFDICICMSIPLLVNSYLLGWAPVPLTQDGDPVQGLVDLCILLAGLTGITLLIMWQNRQLTRIKACALCALYCVFIAYAVAGSLGFSILQGGQK